MKRVTILISALFLLNFAGVAAQAADDFVATPNWSTDVLVSPRPSVKQTCLKFYRPENRLFAILRIVDAGNSKLSVNMSKDFGSTWEETYMLELPGIAMRDVDATIYYNPFDDCILGDTLYVAYPVGELQKWIVLRKFSPITGEELGIAGSQMMANPIKEVAILTDPGDVLDIPVVRAVLLMEPDGLKGFVYDPYNPSEVTWENFPEHDSQNADRGLDFSMYRQWKDENYFSPRFFISYISTEPMLCLLNNYHTSSWTNWQVKQFPFGNAILTPQNKYTAVSCHSEIGLGCTAFLTSECKFETDLSAVKYFIKYHANIDWLSNDIGTNNNYAADVLTREDHAIAVVYNQLDSDNGNHKCIFKKKWVGPLNYSFTPKEQINDFICNPRIQPSLEWIYAKKQAELYPFPAFGVVYVAFDSLAYFDLSNQVYGILWEQMPLEWKQLQLHVNLNNNMTLTFPSANSAFRLADDERDIPWWVGPPVWTKLGDFIGAFDPRGELCGLDCYDGTDLNIMIAGDNPQTPVTDGFLPGELMTIQIVRPDSNMTYTLKNLEFVQGTGNYIEGDTATIYNFEFTQNVTDLPETESAATPNKFVLHQNFPNPFNPETLIRYELPKASIVKLEIYNLIGQKVKTLLEKQQNIGVHSSIWNGTDSSGKNVSSGIYVYKLQTDEFVQVRKLTLMR